MNDDFGRLDPELIEACMKRARRERSEYIGGLIVDLATRIAKGAGQLVRPPSAGCEARTPC